MDDVVGRLRIGHALAARPCDLELIKIMFAALRAPLKATSTTF